ncbi:unnamed protein product [Prorocentrum cordatum]|uniref:Uncharacterized protein n=1 Tax=Prorocentrum cordatum TaxID=2364126 RepID=A0ABN9XZT1_9DINO|nr:unnamed protein product [Polarella glacialis]
MHVLTVSHSCLILQQGPTPLLERMRLRNDRYAWTCGKTHAEREAQQKRAKTGHGAGRRSGTGREAGVSGRTRRGGVGGRAAERRSGGQRETTEVQMQKKTGGS